VETYKKEKGGGADGGGGGGGEEEGDGKTKRVECSKKLRCGRVLEPGNPRM